MTNEETCGACNGSRRMPRDPDIGTDQECFVCDGSGVIAANEAKAAPAVPDTDELESALERLVERCNTDQFLCNDEAVIHAEATLERVYKSRKSSATPSQPVNRPQNCGTSFCSCIECVCEPSPPVTLTDEEIIQAMRAAVWPDVLVRHVEGARQFVAALREKELT